MTNDRFRSDRNRPSPSPAPRRYLALWCPLLPTDRIDRDGGRRDEALCLVEKDRGALRLFACNRAAAALGLRPGLALADARARFPNLPVLDADPEGDARALSRLAADCERYTPLVAEDHPHGLILDVTGCARLFGGETALIAGLRRRLAGFGLTTRAALAGTPDAARALARFGPGGIVAPGGEEAAVRPLPTACLGLPAPTLLALSRAGLTTIACLADRPSSTLSARFGEGLAAGLRRLLGREDHRIVPLRAPPAIRTERHFAEPILALEAMNEVLASLAAEAAEELERRGEGGRRFEIVLFRSDGAVRRLTVETGRPSRDAAALLRLYRERVEALADPLDPGFGFDAMRLSVLLSEPLADAQPDLDRRSTEDEDVADLVDRLVARFGRERVLRFVAEDSHDPGREARAVPATAAGPASPVPSLAPSLVPWPETLPGDPPARPLQLFWQPQPIETLAEVPDGPPVRFRWRRVLHEIASAEGPERIEPEWWGSGRAMPVRDYYRVEDREGRRFWVFRACLYGMPEAPRWYLHGLFA